MKLKYCLVVLCSLLTFNAIAQNGSVSITPIYDTVAKTDMAGDGNFCSALKQLINDANKGFARAKGKEIEVHAETAIWSSNMGIPGAKTSSLIFTSSWQYEGVMYLGNSAADMRSYYDKYKKLVSGCLQDEGYDLKTEKNMEPKLNSYPELIYSKPSWEAPRVTMKVEYTENTGTYTMSVNVWQGGK